MEANDCCAFENQKDHGDAIQHFSANTSDWQVFHFGANSKDEIAEIAYFNYPDAKWYAGRLVGEATFELNKKLYKIKVKPRFGTVQLFRMLEEVFNVRLSESQNFLSQEDELQFLIRKLISFLWLSVLARANMHGLPRHNVDRTHKGGAIRGKLNIRKSIKPLFIEKQLISDYKEKSLHELVRRILNSSYDILIREYQLGTMNIPSNAQDALMQITAGDKQTAVIGEHLYRKISYKSIYSSFKPVVDLSWDIIKKKNIGSEQTNTEKDSLSFFIDMAEIWEMYLRSLLKRSFSTLGWTVKSEKYQVYQENDFRRGMIPDIVMRRGDKIMVWDAKYKRMQYDYYDYDRTDFFQIHTYIDYLRQNRDVIAGGLLYPLTSPFDTERQRKNRTDTLYASGATRTQFVVDGIDLSDNKGHGLTTSFLLNAEREFVSRMSSLKEV